MYPDSVTISLASLLSRFESGQLFDLAGATLSAGVVDSGTGDFQTITGSGVNDGTIGVNDLLRFLALYGTQFQGPADDLQTFNPSDDDVFFNFPDQPEE